MCVNNDNDICKLLSGIFTLTRFSMDQQQPTMCGCRGLGPAHLKPGTLQHARVNVQGSSFILYTSSLATLHYCLPSCLLPSFNPMIRGKAISALHLYHWQQLFRYELLCLLLSNLLLIDCLSWGHYATQNTGMTHGVTENSSPNSQKMLLNAVKFVAMSQNDI